MGAIPGAWREIARLTEDGAKDRHPTFSPDGSRIVWVSERSGLDELWLMELESGATSRLTDDPRAEQAPLFVRASTWTPAPG